MFNFLFVFVSLCINKCAAAASICYSTIQQGAKSSWCWDEPVKGVLVQKAPLLQYFIRHKTELIAAAVQHLTLKISLRWKCCLQFEAAYFWACRQRESFSALSLLAIASGEEMQQLVLKVLSPLPCFPLGWRRHPNPRGLRCCLDGPPLGFPLLPSPTPTP